MKDSIIKALKGENIKLQKKYENLETRLFDLEKASNKQDQYTRRNNLEIHGIPVDVKDEQLEQKVIDIFSHLNISFLNQILKTVIDLANLTLLIGLSIARFVKMHLRKSLRSIDLLITQSLVLKGRTSCLFVKI